nr:hypothetical protein [Kribbella pittospori]
MLDWVAGEELVQQVCALVEALGELSALGGLAEPGVVPARAGPEAEDEPAVREVLQRACLEGELGRAASGQRDDHRPDQDSAGGLRDRGERHPGIGNRRFVRRGAEQVPHEEPVPAVVLGRNGEIAEDLRAAVLAERLHIGGVAHGLSNLLRLPGRVHADR